MTLTFIKANVLTSLGFRCYWSLCFQALTPGKSELNKCLKTDEIVIEKNLVHSLQNQEIYFLFAWRDVHEFLLNLVTSLSLQYLTTFPYTCPLNIFPVHLKMSKM